MHWRILLAAGIAAGALIGFGIIMWVAANWSEMSRMTRFALVGSGVVAGCLGAMAHSSARIPGALIAFLATGGLFALIGQTYQSGSDPWELFALWAALGLPLAIATRHDALWSPWVVVAFTGLTLWAGTRSVWFSKFSDSTVLSTWACAGLLLAGVYCVDRMLKPPGQARWAFRLGAVMTIGMVTGGGLDALVSRSLSGSLAGLAIVVLLLAVAAFYFARPMEFGLMAVGALALNVLIIFLLARLMFSANALDFGAFLFLGLVAGGLVAGTATVLLKLPRPSVQGMDGEASVAAEDSARNWPVTVLSGLGAILASIPLLIFAAMTFGRLLQHWQFAISLGGMLLAGAVLLIRTAAPLTFRQQFGFITMVMGYALLGFGLANLMTIGNAALAMAVALLIGAVVTPVGWIRTLLGAAMAIAIAVWIEMQFFPVGGVFRAQGLHAFFIIALLAGAGLLAAERLPRSGMNAAIGEVMTGVVALTLVALAATSGRTFLLGGVDMGGGVLPAGSGALKGWTMWRVAGLLAGCCAIALLAWRGGPALRSPVAFALGGAGLIMSALTTNLGAVLLLMAASFITGRRVLAAVAVCVVLWIIGAFYYWLGWTLTEKAYLLIAMGAVLAVVAAFSRRSASSTVEFSGLAPGLSAAFAIPLIAASGLATAAIAGLGIRDKETLIATGRPVFVALAPVDPRSLMQGDYMALRFALPGAETLPDLPIAGAPYGVAKVDARNLATVERIVHGQPSAAANEIALKLKIKNRRLMLGTDAWYFKEGEAKKYEAARFGEFRVGPDGEMILVGMADKDMIPIR